MSEAQEIYKVGDLTAELVFRAGDIYNLSDLQEVLDQVEVALNQAREKALRDALQRIADLKRGHSEDVDEGQEQAYRAIETLITKNKTDG